MNLDLIFIGKTTEKYLAEGVEIYINKIENYLPAKITLINPSKEKTTERILKDEAERILKNILSKDFVIILDEKGKEFTSTGFSGEIQKIINRSFSRITFVTGSAYGMDDSLRKRANLIISFSKFTFTHQMIRLLLTEQLYRALTILKGEKYHH